MNNANATTWPGAIGSTAASHASDRIILRAKNLHKTYRLGRVSVPVLRGASLEVRQGEWVALLGASGSGKSTLLHLLGDLDHADADVPADSGIEFSGRSLDDLSQREHNRYRNESIGFVFQFYHLLPELSVLDNTVLPSMMRTGWLWWLVGLGAVIVGVLCGGGVGYLVLSALQAGAGVGADWSPTAMMIIGGMLGAVVALLVWPKIALRRGPGSAQRRARAAALLNSFGLGHRLDHRPRELSGGERQRVAIARALMNNPQVLLADEPTGNLDEKTGREILDLVAQQHRKGLTIVMVTHDLAIAKRADRIVRLHDGRVTDG
jgi:lipoprotein-releasing system ATP-binding protein